MKFTSALAAATLALVAVPIGASAAEPVRAFMGSRTVVKTKNLYPHLGKDEGYGEKYTFDGDFGDRGSLYFSMTISNLGMGDHKMEAKGRLTIDGKKFRWKKELDDDEWKWSKTPFRIKAGPATLSGSPKELVMTVKQGGNDVTFTFTPLGRAWRPKNGQIQFGKDRKSADFTVFPLMNVKASGTFNGAALDVKGTGFGTHTWSDLAIYDQARWTRQFRGIDGDKTIYMRELFTAEDYGNETLRYVLVTKGKMILLESYDYVTNATETLTDTKHDNRYKVPESFTIQGFDDEMKQVQFRGKITKKKQIKREDLLKKMNAAVRLIAGRYSKPVRYDYESDFHIQVKTADGVEELKGVGRYEMYHWNK